MDTQIDGASHEAPNDAQVDEAAEMLKLIADPTRLRILWALLHGEHSVNLLADHVGAQPAAVSQHLAKLRLGHLVSTRREGTHVFYRARNDHVRQIVGEALFHALHVLQGLPDHDVPDHDVPDHDVPNHDDPDDHVVVSASSQAAGGRSA